MNNPKNAEKTVDELKNIVAKNMEKDPNYYIKNAMFGVEGLKAGYGMSKVQSDIATENDQEGKGYGIKYAMGDITVGAGRTINQDVNTSTEDKVTTYGVTYNVNDQLSVGVAAGKLEVEGTANDEEYQTFQVGYDLGGMVVTAGFYQVENVGGTSGSDNENLEIRTVTKF